MEKGKDLKEITDVHIDAEMSPEKLELTGSTNVKMLTEEGTEKLTCTENVQFSDSKVTVVQEIGLQHVCARTKEDADDETREGTDNISHHEAEGEKSQIGSGTSIQNRLNLSSDWALQNDLIIGTTSSSPTETVEQQGTGKSSGVEKCTGAKKRKQGFVRRVPQSPDPEDAEKSPKAREREHLHESRSPKGQDPVSSEDGDDRMRDSYMHEVNLLTPPLLKILKAVNYTNNYVGGKPDVTVQFKVSRYGHYLPYLSMHDQENKDPKNVSCLLECKNLAF
jgi:hypothetical protein